MQNTKNHRNGQVETHWRGRLTDNSSSFYGTVTTVYGSQFRRPTTMHDLVPEMKRAAMTTVSEVLPRQPPKLLLKVMIMGSLGAVQMLMTPESSVRDLIAAAMRQYVKEGRGPILPSSDPFRFDLHYSKFSLESELLCEVEVEAHVPKNFIWPKEYLEDADEELKAPIVDLDGFLKGEDEATQHASKLINEACLNHGFFQVINHGVDVNLIAKAYDEMDTIFKLPNQRKMSVYKAPGSMWGYSGAHAHRFSSKLPWKETFSFPYHHNALEPLVTNYFKSTLGTDFQQAGATLEKYCKAMKELGMKLTELLAISLEVEDRLHYKELFDEGLSIMRLNNYPSCQQPNLVLGTGPHCDPTSITLLHQDQVGGLQVFSDNKWHFVPPLPNAFVVNIGDTFTALSNGRYKSCLHRAVVNEHKDRRSLAFFLCPKENKVLRPHQDIIHKDGTKMYPDFTWSDLLQFTQKYYRADQSTLSNFTHWLLSSKPHT